MIATALPVKERLPQQDPTDDVDLMEGVARHNRVAFDALHKRFAGAIYSTAYRVLNNPSDAEEVMQDVFNTIWNKATVYEPRKGKPLTWASTMARNRAIDRLRGNQRRFRLKDQFRDEVMTDEPVTKRDASDEADLKDRTGILRDALIELTKDQREAIELVYLNGLTQKEAAEILHQPLGTVKARVRRGIARLRGLMEPVIV